jgi:hypothetical protein
LEEEALALEQKLGEAEASVEKGEKRLAELSAQLASGANGSKEMREKVKEKEVRSEATWLRVLRAELWPAEPKMALASVLQCGYFQ